MAKETITIDLEKKVVSFSGRKVNISMNKASKEIDYNGCPPRQDIITIRSEPYSGSRDNYLYSQKACSKLVWLFGKRCAIVNGMANQNHIHYDTTKYQAVIK